MTFLEQKTVLVLNYLTYYPTFVDICCLLSLALGERVIRLKPTAATSQLLALLMKQFLVMWANKLVHT